jgi:hypothetical protein
MENPDQAYVSSPGDTQEDRERDNLTTGEGEWVGEEPNHRMARKPGPSYIIQFSLLSSTW